MNQSENSSHIYLERSGVGVEPVIEELLLPPEFPLSPEQRVEVDKFAADIFRGSHGELKADIPQTLAEVYFAKALAARQTFYLDYFESDAGEGDRRLLGLRDGTTKAEKKAALCDFTMISATTDHETRVKIARRSLDFVQAELTGRLLADPEGKQDGRFDDPEKVTVHFKPDTLLDKVESLTKYRRFYTKVLKSLEGESVVDQAKREITQLSLGRVNSVLAELYPSAVKLVEQCERTADTPASAVILERLEKMAPVLKHVTAADTPSGHTNSFLRRLDYLRNGVWVEGDGVKARTVSVVSKPVLDLVDTLAIGAEGEGQPRLSPELIAELDNISWGADEFKQFCEFVLREWGVLSEHPATWEELDTRAGWAPDRKLQVVITPKADSLAVDYLTGAFTIPLKYDRTLTQTFPAGALPVAAHELTHGLQHMVAQSLGEQLPLAQLRGRHSLTLREGAGLYQEQIVQEEYLGRYQPANINYLRALQVKLAGGNVLQVTRAFFDESVRSHDRKSQTDLKRQAAAAVNRAQRLYRHGGFDSQPLDYIEQALIVDELKKMGEEQASNFGITQSVFDLKDAVRLHRLGLLPTPDMPFQPAHDVMRIFLEKWYPKHKQIKPGDES